MIGRVALVGAGPGDPELLTLRAIRTIRRATVLLVDDLVGAHVLRYARRSARVVHVGKRGGCRSTPQAFIERLMVTEARHGEFVVRLKGGDPFVFGRGGEEVERLRALGIEVEVVHGITAGLPSDSRSIVSTRCASVVTTRRSLGRLARSTIAAGVAAGSAHSNPARSVAAWATPM